MSILCSFVSDFFAMLPIKLSVYGEQRDSSKICLTF